MGFRLSCLCFLYLKAVASNSVRSKIQTNQRGDIKDATYKRVWRWVFLFHFNTVEVGGVGRQCGEKNKENAAILNIKALG